MNDKYLYKKKSGSLNFPLSDPDKQPWTRNKKAYISITALFIPCGMIWNNAAHCIVLVLDGNSLYVAHARWKIGLFIEENPIWD